MAAKEHVPEQADGLAAMMQRTPPAIAPGHTFESCRALLMRCTQYVHFSITPRLRTVTLGLRCSL